MAGGVVVWLIWLPLAAAPLVYLGGRLGQRWHRPSAAHWLALLALLATGWPLAQAVWMVAAQGQVTVTIGAVMLRLDGLSVLVTAVVLLLAALVVLASGPVLQGELGAEKYAAMLVAMTGTIIGLSCAADLFNLWLWFEAMAITSYLLVAFHRDQPAVLEAGVKYLVQNVVGSVLVLLGVALVLGQTGTLDLAVLRTQAVMTPGLLAAGGLFIVGFGVKIALVPLHTWLPDAHAQAPSGVSALLSGMVIEAGLVALLRALTGLAGAALTWGSFLLGFGVLNMVVGNLLALPQTQIKRLLAFSSISHIGYMLVGLGLSLMTGRAAGAQAGLFHLLNHALMKGLAFLATGALLYGLASAAEQPGHALQLTDMAGAVWRYPLTAVALIIALLGLGGIPPLAGFMSKWQILAAGLAASYWPLAVLVAANSLLSLGYYLPLVAILFRRELSAQGGRPLPLTMTFPLGLLAMLVVAIGLWPGLVSWLTEPAGLVVAGAFAAP